MSFRRKLADSSAWVMTAAAVVAAALFAVSIFWEVSVNISLPLRQLSQGRTWIGSLILGVEHAALQVELLESIQSGVVMDGSAPMSLSASETQNQVAWKPAIERHGQLPFLSATVTTLPVWIVIPVLAAWPMYWLTHRPRPARPGECGHCGYDLRGTVDAKSDNCPECGKPITKANTKHE